LAPAVILAGVRSRDPVVLLDQARAGDAAATGRLISLIEREGDLARRVAALTFAGASAIRRIVGVTGPPGGGKSTLTDRLIGQARSQGPVGVIAVDPSSPFTGGALLGDRVRMSGHSGDGGVFIRSMATRGHVGGLSLAVPDAVRVLGAVGMPTVILETVGVGQVEVEIAGAADTTIVVVNPGWGDSVQANKAGLLEIADIFVVNKADRPGAAETRRDLAAMVDTDPHMGEWRPPIVLTTAATGAGVGELWEAVVDHGVYLQRSGELVSRREQHLLDELHRAIVGRAAADVRHLAGGEAYERVAAAVLAYELEPRAAAGQLLDALGRARSSE
jgi:LAO/AO transport system kinase